MLRVSMEFGAIYGFNFTPLPVKPCYLYWRLPLDEEVFRKVKLPMLTHD
jgi:hypothetical protein